jgi:hypothetical protein
VRRPAFQEIDMNRQRFKRIVLATVLSGFVAGIVGCASDPRYAMGPTWIKEIEAEKARLNAAGFPQYNWE